MTRARGRALTVLAWGAALVVPLCVGALLASIVARGLPALRLELFFDDVPPLDAVLARRPVWDGAWPAVVGTVSLLVVTMALAVVPGVACGAWLACFASPKERERIGACVDTLAGVPSIVMGLFGLEVIIALRRTFMPQGTTCLLLAALCLAILVMPVLVGATRAALEALPPQLSLTGAALGMSRAQTVRRLLIPAAGPGILGGAVLAMGRAMEDTAVIMLTGAVANAGLPAGLGAKFEALPFKIYHIAAQWTGPEDLARGFGSALALLILSGTLLTCARVLQARLARRWRGATSRGGARHV
ncbi:MAG: ABC transporter permease subunit [Synergistaceae bacterium]|nr:ABC transporter permease subunit [Synergistaceae bacterium]